MRFEVKVLDRASYERELLAAIDASAEAVRGIFITNTASQPAVYLQKEAEAEAFMADFEISPTLIPNIVLEAARVGDSFFNVAAVILNQAQVWRGLSALIEDIRLGAKDAVRAAETPAAMRAAAVIDWSPITNQAGE